MYVQTIYPDLQPRHKIKFACMHTCIVHACNINLDLATCHHACRIYMHADVDCLHAVALTFPFNRVACIHAYACTPTWTSFMFFFSPHIFFLLVFCRCQHSYLSFAISTPTYTIFVSLGDCEIAKRHGSKPVGIVKFALVGSGPLLIDRDGVLVGQWSALPTGKF